MAAEKEKFKAIIITASTTTLQGKRYSAHSGNYHYCNFSLIGKDYTWSVVCVGAGVSEQKPGETRIHIINKQFYQNNSLVLSFYPHLTHFHQIFLYFKWKGTYISKKITSCSRRYCPPARWGGSIHRR